MRHGMGYVPKYTITAHLLRLLENIASLRTKIEMSTVSVAWIPRLTKEAFSRMAHSSTAIEGNPLTLKEVQILADGGGLPQAKPRYVREIFNYFAALRYISHRANKKSISKEDILRLHAIVGKDAIDRDPLGAFRTYQVYVGGHIPPKAKHVSPLIKALIEWLNGKGQSLPAVIASAILHYQFEFIHPFGDGNGRVGRVLSTWELYRRRFDTHHIFSVDEIFWENRQRYYNALSNVRGEKGDLTGWLEFAAEAIELTLERVWARIESVRTLQKKGAPMLLTPKQERLLRLLQNTPLGIREIQEELEVTKAGAHFLLKPLIENNLVKRAGGYKTGKYLIV
jgi:Fic family protein